MEKQLYQKLKSLGYQIRDDYLYVFVKPQYIATPIYIFRHGETQANITKKISSFDESITENSRHEIALAIEKMAATSKAQLFRVFCSPQRRALQTAEIVCQVLQQHGHNVYELETDARLREMELQNWENRTMKELIESDIIAQKMFLHHDIFASPQGEGFFEVMERANSFAELLNKHVDYTPIVISHAVTITALKLLLGFPSHFYHNTGLFQWGKETMTIHNLGKKSNSDYFFR
ncbi:histidine phosphatase family protein [Candidatus Uabimicrobium sp. HlEnr_7]|uniref:histidine phosphatase family protein n=1 Tax=Candidatus Uabimicrobium helgolandensis TaxID=3095367 RepID=UPI0035582DCE